MTERIPPQAIEAEQSVLGSMLQDKESLHHGIEKLREESFYNPRHRKIFAAIKDLYESSKPVDLITVPDELTKREQLDEIGGRKYLLDLVDGAVSHANVPHYIRMILGAAVRNQLIEDCHRIEASCYDESIVSEDLLDMAQQKVFKLAGSSTKSEFKPLRQIIPNVMDRMEERGKMDNPIMGIPSGFGDIDRKTCGFQRSDLVVIAGRPSMGKTAFALNIAEYVAVEHKIPTAVFSLEMSEEQLGQRLITSHARIPFQDIRRGSISDEEWRQVSITAGKLNEAPLYLDDTPALSASEIRAKARRLKLKYDIQLVMVDYLQLVKGQRNPENRQQEISYISQSMKALAKELDIPVLALSQLSRQVELRGKDARPQLSDLRESGAIEQDADVVIFIHRPREKSGKLSNKAEIIIGKQRNGPTGIVELVFLDNYTRFEQALSNVAEPCEIMSR